MRPIVVDASVVAEFLLGTPRGQKLEALLNDPEVELHVPALCDIEMAAVLRRAWLSRRLGAERAYDALEDYLDLPLARHGHAYLLGRVFGLRRNVSAYDATYLALAEWLEAALLTSDEALKKAAQQQSGVEVL